MSMVFGLIPQQTDDSFERTVSVEKGRLKSVAPFPPLYIQNEVIVINGFSRLSPNEKTECLRIMNNKKFRIFYNYDNDNTKENSSIYVLKNLRHILQLPNDGVESDFLKYAMITSLGKMRFLSSRNIDLLYALRKFAYSVYKGFDDYYEGSNDDEKTLGIDLTYLFGNLLLGKRCRLVNTKLYGNQAEARWYVFLTLQRWQNSQNFTLREIIQQQETLKEKLEDFTINTFDRDKISLFEKVVMRMSAKKDKDFSFLEPFDDEPDNELEKYLLGLLDCTSREFGFFTLLIKEDFGLSIQDFVELYLPRNALSKISVSECFNRLRKIIVKEEFPKIGLSYALAFFVYCFLDDEEKFVPLFEQTELFKHDREIVDNGLSLEFLDFLKDYSREDNEISLSLLMGIYGLGDYFSG